MIKSITEKCSAKINIAIDVLGKYPNGYHEVRMIMTQVGIFDVITISLKDERYIGITGSDINMPVDKSNLAWKAANEFFKAIKFDGGCDVYIEKHIPMGAGMAGGSSDAAGVINGLNKLFDSPLSLEERMKIGEKLGADVPFCVMGGCALAEGIGERLTSLPELPKVYYLIAKPKQSISTKWVYEHLDYNDKPVNLDIDKIISGIKSGDLKKIQPFMGNILEKPAVQICPEVNVYKAEMMNLGADIAMMSGSGSAVFGMFDDSELAIKAYNEFKLRHSDADGVWILS